MGLAKKVDLSKQSPVFDARGNELAKALYNQFNTFHSRDYRPNKEVEQIAMQQRQLEFDLIGVRTPRPNMPIFSPSGASKCSRELYFKALGTPMADDKQPYHRRWTRNSTAVHEATQRDLLYMSKLMKNPAFTVKLMENGLPAWEENLKTFVELEHNGFNFAVLGMMDGILQYKDGSQIGFEFKTKSNSIGQVGNYKMKDSAPYHKEQCTAYSILFGLDEFIFMYESVAKDQWSKGIEAKSDIRTFYYKVTEEARVTLLDKFAGVVQAVNNREIPAKEPDKCLFCPYKDVCEKEDN